MHACMPAVASHVMVGKNLIVAAVDPGRIHAISEQLVDLF
jgi:hypothetical protein